MFVGNKVINCVGVKRTIRPNLDENGLEWRPNTINL